MRVALLAALVAGAVAATGAALALRGGDEQAAWRLGAAMSQRRSYIAAAELGGNIYAAGGMVGETGRPLATLQRYDPPENAWTTLAPLPRPVRAAAAAAVGRTISFSAGGERHSRCTPSVIHGNLAPNKSTSGDSACVAPGNCGIAVQRVAIMKQRTRR